MADQGIYMLFNQDRVWVDAQGAVHQLDEMSARYKGNVVRFIERRAGILGWKYGLGELEAIFAPVGREILGFDEDGQPRLGRLVEGGPRGDAACDAVESFIDEADRARAADPVAWIRTTKLMQRLCADVAAGVGGEDG